MAIPLQLTHPLPLVSKLYLHLTGCVAELEYLPTTSPLSRSIEERLLFKMYRFQDRKVCPSSFGRFRLALRLKWPSQSRNIRFVLLSDLEAHRSQ